MEEKSIKGCIPNVVSYNTVLKAFANDKARAWASEAEELIQRMIELSSSQERPSVKPNIITLNTFLNILSRVGTADAVAKARKLLMSTTNNYDKGVSDVRPDTFSFNAVIKVCANVRGSQVEKEEALQTACEIFELLEKTNYAKPSYFTFTLMLQAVTRLANSQVEANELFESIVKKCITRKLVSRGVLHQMHRASMPQVKQLDPEWSRNVPSYDRP